MFFLLLTWGDKHSGMALTLGIGPSWAIYVFIYVCMYIYIYTYVCIDR